MRESTKSKKGVVYTLLFCAALLGAGLFVGQRERATLVTASVSSPKALNSTLPTLTPSSTPTPVATATAVTTSTPQPEALKAAIQNVVSAHPELTIGVSFIDVQSGERVDVGGAHIFTAASTTKVFVACLLLSQVEEGKHSLNQSLAGETVGWQLQQMINQSNNDSWMALMQFIGYTYQPPYAAKIGITTYNYQNNQISANDEALLLDKLYTGQLLNKADTSLLLSYMQHTNMEDLIPPAVPAGVQVYHKYGNYDDNLHDAAIIDDGKDPFVLTIYTADGNQEAPYLPRYDVFHALVKAVEENK